MRHRLLILGMRWRDDSGLEKFHLASMTALDLTPLLDLGVAKATGRASSFWLPLTPGEWERRRISIQV
jgi:hypothetical protein